MTVTTSTSFWTIATSVGTIGLAIPLSLGTLAFLLPSDVSLRDALLPEAASQSAQPAPGPVGLTATVSWSPEADTPESARALAHQIERAFYAKGVEVAVLLMPSDEANATKVTFNSGSIELGPISVENLPGAIDAAKAAHVLTKERTAQSTPETHLFWNP